MSTSPIAEDYDDIAKRLKAIEDEKAPPKPDAPAEQLTPAELLVRDYGYVC